MSKKVKIVIPQSQKIKKEDILSDEIEYKKVEENTKRIIFKSSKNIRNSNTQIIRTITNITSVLIFIIITGTILISIINDIFIDEKLKTLKGEIKLTNNITGSWKSSNNGLFVFNKDNSFYWYNSFNNLQDNYYKGTYNYKTGQEALDEMGFTEEELKKEYDGKIKPENVYSINLKPTSVQKNKIDITSVELNENETWWYILLINDDNTANGYNKALDLKYNLIKIAE